MRPLALLLALACVAAVVNGMQPSCDAERITCKTCQGNADSNVSWGAA